MAATPKPLGCGKAGWSRLPAPGSWRVQEPSDTAAKLRCQEVTYSQPALQAPASPSDKGGRRLKPAYKGGRRNKFLLERQSSPRRLLHFLPLQAEGRQPSASKLASSTGEALLPQTPSNRRQQSWLLHCLFSPALRSVHRRRRQLPDARPPGAREGGTGSFLLLLFLLLPALAGRISKLILLSFVIVSSLVSPKGGPESFLFLSLTWGRLRLPHTPTQSSEAASCLLLHWWFSVA